MRAGQETMGMEQRQAGGVEQGPGVGDDTLHLFESLHTLIAVATSYLMTQTKHHMYMYKNISA